MKIGQPTGRHVPNPDEVERVVPRRSGHAFAENGVFRLGKRELDFDLITYNAAEPNEPVRQLFNSVTRLGMQSRSAFDGDGRAHVVQRSKHDDGPRPALGFRLGHVQTPESCAMPGEAEVARRRTVRVRTRPPRRSDFAPLVQAETLTAAEQPAFVFGEAQSDPTRVVERTFTRLQVRQRRLRPQAGTAFAPDMSVPRWNDRKIIGGQKLTTLERTVASGGSPSERVSQPATSPNGRTILTTAQASRSVPTKLTVAALSSASVAALTVAAVAVVSNAAAANTIGERRLRTINHFIEGRSNGGALIAE